MKWISDLITHIGGRRFLLTIVSGMGTFLLMWAAKITGEVYATVTIATVAAYIGGNTTQKIKGTKDST